MLELAIDAKTLTSILAVLAGILGLVAVFVTKLYVTKRSTSVKISSAQAGRDITVDIKNLSKAEAEKIINIVTGTGIIPTDGKTNNGETRR